LGIPDDGGEMNINVDFQMSEEREIELSKILNCTREDLPEKLSPYANASLEEYTSMFLGEKVFTRGSDILEHRLCLLIEKVFENRIPSENRVSRLFQTTVTGSRALIRSVVSKYQYKLKTALESSMKEAISSAEITDNEEIYECKINSSNLVNSLNQILADIDGELARIKSKTGTSSVYEITPSALAALQTRLGLNQGTN
jgi:hypothetical protein